MKFLIECWESWVRALQYIFILLIKTLNILFKQQVNVHRSRASDPKHCDVQRNEQCKWNKQIWNKERNQTKNMQQQKTNKQKQVKQKRYRQKANKQNKKITKYVAYEWTKSKLLK